MTAGNESPRPARRRPRPTAAAVIAVLALVMAAVGTGIAANHGKLSGAKVKKRSQPGNRLKKNTLTGAEIKESKLGQVPKAGDAQTLQGHPPADFLANAKVVRFAARLNFGQSQVLFSAGPLTFTGTCTQNATNPFGDLNQDFSDIVISTSQNGAVFDGEDSKRGDNAADPTTFLNTDTPADQRDFYIPNSTNTGTSDYDAENNSDGAAFAPDGTAVAFNAGGLAGGTNEFGAACTIDGFAWIVSG